MVLNRLVWSCLQTGTHHSECGITVSIKPQSNERILFFRTDSPRARKVLEMSDDSHICDVVVFHVSQVQEEPPTFLLVELKGNDCHTAVKQISSTARALRRFMPRRLFGDPRFHGVILCAHGAPQDQRKLFSTLSKNGINPQLKSGCARKTIDLRGFLK